MATSLLNKKKFVANTGILKCTIARLVDFERRIYD